MPKDYGTASYLVGDCMRYVISQSFTHCGFIEHGGCGPNGALRIIDGFRSTSCTCVDDPNAAIYRNLDVDRDGIPDRRDNCPFAYNPEQSNCNEVAERARGVPMLGDGCDPVPCPETVAEVTSDGFTSTPENDPRCRPNAPPPEAPNQVTYVCTKTDVSDRFIHDPVGTYPIDSKRLPEHPDNYGRVPAVDTALRYCQNSPAIVCSDPRNIRDDLLDQASSAAAETRDTVWHRITTGKNLGAPRISSEFPLRDRHYVWDYGGTHDVNSWSIQSDVDFWRTGGKITFPPADPGCAGGSCLSGSIWLKGDTNFGAALRGAGLVNKYFGIEARTTYSYCPTLDWLYHGLTFGSLDSSSTSDRASAASSLQAASSRTALQSSSLSKSYLLWQAGTSFRAFNDQRDTELLVPTSSQLVAAIRDNGMALIAENVGDADCGGSRIGSALKASLYNGTRWLNAIEPVSPSVASRDYMSVAIAMDGTQLIDEVDVRSGQLMAREDRPICSETDSSACASNQRCLGGFCRYVCSTDEDCRRIDARLGSCGADHVCQAAPDALQSRTTLQLRASGPAPRTDFVAFFSRAAEGVYLIGGKDASTGNGLGDIWYHRAIEATGAEWTQLPLAGATLGMVHAATYSFHDQHLWILDEASPDHLRLLRVNAHSGEASVAATWKTKDVDGTVHLSVDRDGRVLLTRARRKDFFVARLEVNENGELGVTGRYHERGELVLPPFVSFKTYAFPVKNTRTPMKVVRHQEIFHEPGGRILLLPPLWKAARALVHGLFN